MRKLTANYWLGAASLACAFNANANTIIYDYIGDPLVAAVYNSNTRNPVPGATRVTGSIEFSGRVAASINSRGAFRITEPVSTGGFGIPGVVLPPNPDIKWSISDGVNSYNQSTGGISSSLDFTFDNGVLTSSFLRGANGSAFSVTGVPGINLVNIETNYAGRTGSSTLLSTNNLLLDPAASAFAGSPVFSIREVQYMQSAANGSAQWVLRQNVSTVPAPAALPLLASALGMFGLGRRRLS